LNAGENKTRDEIQSALERMKGITEGQPHIALDWLYADTEAEIARYLKRTLESPQRLESGRRSER